MEDVILYKKLNSITPSKSVLPTPPLTTKPSPILTTVKIRKEIIPHKKSSPPPPTKKLS